MVKKRVSFLLMLGLCLTLLIGFGCTAAAPAAGKITVFAPEVTTWPNYMPTLQRFMKDYPDIEVDFSSVKNDQYVAAIQTKLASNDIPDVFVGWVGIAQYENYVNQNYVLDLSHEKFLDRLKDVAKDSLRVGGKIYGVPINVQEIGIIYNKKIYRDLHLAVPKTWEELMANCEAIKKAGKTPFALGIKDNFVTQMLPYTIWPSVLYGKNPQFENQRIAGKVKYNSPEWKKALEMTRDVFDKGYTNSGVLGISYDQQLELFATEKAAMLCMGDWCVETLKKINPNLKAGFFATPAPQGYSQVLESQVANVYMISKHTKYPAAAKKFVAEFLTNPKYYYNWNSSPIQSLKVAPTPTDEVYKDYAAAYKKAKASYPFINQRWINAVLGDTFCRDMQEVYAKTKTVDELAGDMDKTFNQILPEYQKAQAQK